MIIREESDIPRTYTASFNGDHHSTTTPGWSLYVSQSTLSGRELHMVPVFASKTMRVCCSCCKARNKCSLYVTCQRKCILSLLLSLFIHRIPRARHRSVTSMANRLSGAKIAPGSWHSLTSTSLYLCRYHSAGPEPIGARDRARDLSPRSHKGE